MSAATRILTPNFYKGSPQEAMETTFAVQSQYYPDHNLDLPNSNMLDFGMCLASAKESRGKCSSIPATERGMICQRAADLLANAWTQQDLDNIVMLQGTPIRSVRTQAAYATTLMRAIGVGTLDCYLPEGNILYRDSQDGRVALLPNEGIAAAFLPPNHVAEAASILANAVMAGATIIIKPSQHEPRTAIMTAEALTKAGYPSGGINVLHWDTSRPESASYTANIIRKTNRHIYMGEAESAASILAGAAPTSRSIIFSTGRSKAIVDQGCDLEKVAERLAYGALHWTNTCVATKTAIIVGERDYNTLCELLSRRFNDANVGDPLDENTEIGYAPTLILDQIESLVNASRQFDNAEILLPYERISAHQMRPLLMSVNINDPESPFATQEMPYTLTLVKADSIDEAVGFVNSAAKHAPEQRVMAVSIYTPAKSLGEYLSRDVNCDAITRLRAATICHNRPSIDFSPYLPHEAKDLVAFLSNPTNMTEGR